MSRFSIAMLGFAALAILALTTLRDEKVQTVTLLLLALFAFKTWLQHRKQRESEEN